VRIMHASRDALIASAAAEVRPPRSPRSPAPSFALIFDCAGRKVVLGSRYQDELRGPSPGLPAGLPKIGFFTYGELAPHAGRTIHHDETFTAVLLRTRPMTDERCETCAFDRLAELADDDLIAAVERCATRDSPRPGERALFERLRASAQQAAQARNLAGKRERELADLRRTMLRARTRIG
jgi:hypothetical protein